MVSARHSKSSVRLLGTAASNATMPANALTRLLRRHSLLIDPRPNPGRSRLALRIQWTAVRAAVAHHLSIGKTRNNELRRMPRLANLLLRLTVRLRVSIWSVGHIPSPRGRPAAAVGN